MTKTIEITKASIQSAGTVTVTSIFTSIETGGMGGPGENGAPGGTVTLTSTITAAGGSCTSSAQGQTTTSSASQAAITTSSGTAPGQNVPSFPFQSGFGNSTLPMGSGSTSSSVGAFTSTTQAGLFSSSSAQIPTITPLFPVPQNTTSRGQVSGGSSSSSPSLQSNSQASIPGFPNQPQVPSFTSPNVDTFSSSISPVTTLAGNTSPPYPISGSSFKSTTPAAAGTISQGVPVPGFPQQSTPVFSNSSQSASATTADLGSSNVPASVPGFPQGSASSPPSEQTSSNSLEVGTTAIPASIPGFPQPSVPTSSEAVPTSPVGQSTSEAPISVPGFPQQSTPLFTNTSTTYLNTAFISTALQTSQGTAPQATRTAVPVGSVPIPSGRTDSSSQGTQGPSPSTIPSSTSSFSHVYVNTGVISFGLPPAGIPVETSTSERYSSTYQSTSSAPVPTTSSSALYESTFQLASPEVATTTGISALYESTFEVSSSSPLPQMTTREGVQVPPITPGTSGAFLTSTKKDTTFGPMVTLTSSSTSQTYPPATSQAATSYPTTTPPTSTCPCSTQTVSFADLPAASPIPSPYNSLVYDNFIALGLGSTHLTAAADQTPTISIPSSSSDKQDASFDLHSIHLLPM